MLVPTTWLSDFVELSGDTEQLTYDLTQIGLEVEEVLRPGSSLDGITLVSLESVEAHPNADDLAVCTISDGTSETTVVTAAENLSTDSVYVWAPPGSSLGDTTVSEQNLRGVPSDGMLCSLEELGLTGSAGALLELSDDFVVGADAVQALDLTDPILEIDLTPNRSDCLSIVGIARDYATATGASLTLPTVEEPDNYETNNDLTVKIEAPDRCREYTGIPITDVTVEPAQPAVQKRLVQLGLQPRNCVVDATNYVLHEMGNPLHAFDRSKLTPPITVRHAVEDEEITTLDGTGLELNEEDLVIADEKQAQALAGVMGGSGSEVTDTTDSLLLEGAFFTPAGIRRTASNHAISTDSSYRFERGIDGGNIQTALHRCIDLIRETDTNNNLTVHEPARAITDTNYTTTISFKPSDFESLIGYPCDNDTKRERLEGIGCSIDTDGNAWTVKTPSWRHDLDRPEDLLEEIVRLDGYESIESEYPSLTLNETPRSKRRLEERLSSHLTAWGFHETTTFSFLPEEAQNLGNGTEPHRLSNPISRQHATMRQSLLDSMLEALRKNLDAGRDRVDLFEIGRVFPGDSQDEPVHLGLLSTGSIFSESWDSKDRPIDYYDVKGLVNLLLTKAGHPDHDIIPGESTGFVENRCGIVEVNDTTIGHLGELEPELIDTDADNAVWGVELDLTSLGETEPVKYNPFSKQPVVKRDLDLVVDRNLYARELKNTIRDNANWLEDIKIFDLYRGEPLPEDEKSISFRLFFRNPDRTLNDDEVNDVQETILDALRDEHGAYLRDE